MLIKYDSSAFRRTKWHEYVSRFVYGGLMTVATGLIDRRFGPSLAGLFLAFPAIFPASVSLIDKHQRKAKEPWASWNPKGKTGGSGEFCWRCEADCFCIPKPEIYCSIAVLRIGFGKLRLVRNRYHSLVGSDTRISIDQT